MGRRSGLAEEKLRGLSDPEGSGAFDERELAVLRYAEAMTRTPVEIPDGLFESLTRQFDSKQLVELTSSIAWENYRARFDHAFGIESAGFTSDGFCPLPTRD